MLLPTGVTVLYGRNGVGKTQILDAFHRALNGRRANNECGVHLRFGERDFDCTGAEQADQGMIHALHESLVSRALQQRTGFDFDLDELDLVAMSVRALVETVLRGTWEHRDAWEKPVDPDSLHAIRSLVAEVAGQGHFCLVPIGGEGESLWRLMISARPSDDTPILNTVIDIESNWEREQTRIQTLFKRGDLSAEEAQGELYALFEASSAQRGNRALPWAQFAERLKEHNPGRREAWVPIPLLFVGLLELEVGMSLSMSQDNARDLAELTFRLARTCNPIVEVVTQDEVVPGDAAAQLLRQLGERATKKLEQIFEDNGPILQCRFQPWGITPPVIWEAWDAWAQSWIPVEKLGSGRSRWAIMAAFLTITEMTREFHEFTIWPDWIDRVIVLDEPELGLHPVAQRDMFSGLAAWGNASSVLVASHSAAAFRNRAIRLVHVDRDADGLIACFSMDDQVQNLLRGDEAQRVGLDPSDLLQAVRRFVVVEGEHDVAVIESILGLAEMSIARVRLLPMRGTKELKSLLDARLLVDYTSAEILVVLDRVDGQRIRELWVRACELYASGREREALGQLRPLENGTPEERKLSEFCNAALRSKKADRITIFGLSKPDIIEYLPVLQFIPSASSWEEVVTQWEHQGDFKEFLRQQGANVSANKLRRIAETLDSDSYHSDLVELAHLCLE